MLKMIKMSVQEYRKIKNQKKAKPAPADLPSYCTSCAKSHSMIRPDRKCLYCKNGYVHTFESFSEGQRFIALHDMPHITHLTVQYFFPTRLPIAKYTAGLHGVPELTGYSDECKERTGYKVDFVYHDSTTTRGWVAEEFKVTEEEMDQATKKKMNIAVDQHSDFGHFCYSFKSKNHAENTPIGIKISSYKRKFVRHAGKKPYYEDYDKYFLRSNNR